MPSGARAAALSINAAHWANVRAELSHQRGHLRIARHPEAHETVQVCHSSAVAGAVLANAVQVRQHIVGLGEVTRQGDGALLHHALELALVAAGG